MIRPNAPAAYKLMHEGAVALAQVEANGLRVDTAYLDATIEMLDGRIRDLEAELQRTDFWRQWRKAFGERSKLGSREQLGKLLFERMGYKCERFSATGRYKVDEESLRDVDLPFVQNYIRVEKLKKARATYLLGLRQETVDGFFHPVFNLHTARTFRSSSGRDRDADVGGGRDFNFQNIPVRNPDVGDMIRRCFVPRRGHVLAEVDYGGIEVRISACYNQDPRLLEYIHDDTKDMHRDMAVECYKLKVGPKDPWWKDKGPEGGHNVRYCAKNQFVFPAFYGSYYAQIAPDLWKSIDRMNLHAPGGVPMRDYLASRGITEYGEHDPKRPPEPGTFLHHVQQVEKRFWGERFRVYDQWKKKWWEAYQRTGRYAMYTGFEMAGYYRKNEVLNGAIQGSAFHCLLWSLTRIHRWLKRHKMRSMVVGQIHDSLILDVHEAELQDVLHKARQVMTEEILKAWQWVIVPLAVEVEVAPENWAGKKQWTAMSGVWAPVKKGR